MATTTAAAASLADIDNSLTSASNAIDDIISMSVLDHDPNNEKSETRLNSFPSRFRTLESLKRLTWNNTSPEQLIRAEMKVFETLKCPFLGRDVPISNNTQRIWTVCSNLSSTNYPIVLVHGFGGGVGLWSLNLDQLCVDRPVYAFDLPGFGRSSRPVFSTNAVEAEQQFVTMIEEWRIAIGLDQPFILLGHSFGGFLCAAYTMRFPTYVKQLILVDPWGIVPKPDDWQTSRMGRIPPWLRSFSNVLTKIAPLSGLRIAGPFGVRIMKYFRSDLQVKFQRLFDDDRILTYLYHCNAQLPTGEQGFRAISDCFSWAKEPIIDRIHTINENIPIYFLHGEKSWIIMDSSIEAQSKRENVYVTTIKDAGHHVYADAPVEFDMFLKTVFMTRE